VHPVGDLVQSLCEVPDGESLAETSSSFVLLPVAVTRVFLSSVVSSAGALADNSSYKMSSRYRSGRVPEGPGVSPTTMKTWRSGVPRPSVRSTCLQSGQYTNIPVGVDVITKPVAEPDSDSSVVVISDSGSTRSDPN
jgi:hypothetical protein